MYERHLKIVELVRIQEYVSVERLAQYFGVTMQTIRRDINKLNEDGLLTRHHGGAGLPTSVGNSNYKTRKNLLLRSKITMTAKFGWILLLSSLIFCDFSNFHGNI